MDVMEKDKCCKLTAVWVSGFFGLGAVVHGMRLLLRVPVTVGAWAVPLRISAVLVLLFSALSVGLLWAAYRGSVCGTGCSVRDPK